MRTAYCALRGGGVEAYTIDLKKKKKKSLILFNLGKQHYSLIKEF